MREKEDIIIQSGIMLFARKGFSSTSIQEIATESGISKGAFYLHFKSKEELMLAIMEFIFETIQSSIAIFDGEDLPPREKFIKQISAVYGTFIEHKEFFVMLSKEQAIPRNDEIKELLFKKSYESHLFYRRGIIQVYGEKVEAFSLDLALILEGLFQSYIRLLIFEPQEFEFEELTRFLMKRMDNIVQGFDAPFLSEKNLGSILEKSKCLFEKKTISGIIKKMREELEQLENKEALEISLDVLEEEIMRENPRIPVIKGMLSNFKDVQSFASYEKEIASFYDIE